MVSLQELNNANGHANPTRALINLSAFESNVAYVRKLAPAAKVILPVKANAYGHGALLIANAAEGLGVEYLAVAQINEGLLLRQAGISTPIIILGTEHGENIHLAIRNNLEFSVSSQDNLAEIENTASSYGRNVAIHLNLDTGMTRLGCSPAHVKKLAEHCHRSRYLSLQSLYTHFAMSDCNNGLTMQQTNLFLQASDSIQGWTTSTFFHLCNSGGLINMHEQVASYFQASQYAVRPGIMCYGYVPDGKPNPHLRPVMTLVSKVVHVANVGPHTGIGYGHTFITCKPTRLATVAIGYGDGLRRALSNRLDVVINGNVYHQRGLISMNLTVVEIDERVSVGDDVYIFGDSHLCINNADDLANQLNTISYEILTSVAVGVDRQLVRITDMSTG